MDTRANRHSYLMLAYFVSLFCFIVFAFYPGIMTADSDAQLEMARAWHFTDWHPPIFSVIWRPLDAIVPGPAGMLVLFAFSYCLAFYLFAVRLAASSRPLAWVACLLAISPLTINFAGVIWKDVMMALCFLLAICAALNRERGWPVIAAGCALVLIGVLSRHNALFAAPPIVYMLFWGTDLASFPRIIGRLVAAAILTLIAYLAANAVMASVLSIKHLHAISSLLVFDLVALSAKLKTNLLPGTWTEQEAAKIMTECYEPRWWDRIWLSCGFVMQRLMAEDNWAVLYRTWFAEIPKHPLLYLDNRFQFLVNNFRIHDYAHVFSPTSEIAKTFAETNHQALVGRYVLAFARNAYTSIFFTLGFWILMPIAFFLSNAAFVLFFRPKYSTSFFVTTSSFVHCSSLFFVAVSMDLRYAYFGIIAGCLGMLFLCAEWINPETTERIDERQASATVPDTLALAGETLHRTLAPIGEALRRTRLLAGQIGALLHAGRIRVRRGANHIGAGLRAALHRARLNLNRLRGRLRASAKQAAILAILLLCFVALVFWFPPRTIIDAVLLAGVLFGLSSTLCIPPPRARAAILATIFLIGLGASAGSYRAQPQAVNVPSEGFEITIADSKRGTAILSALSVDGKFLDLKTLVSAGAFEPYLKFGLRTTDNTLVIRYDKPYFRANLDYLVVGGGADLVIADRSATRLLQTAVPLHVAEERYPFSPRDLASYTGILLLTLIVVGGAFTLMAPSASRIQTPALVAGVFLALLGFWLASYPALFSSDSVDQFIQCSTGIYRDWHPVPHSLAACALRAVADTPFSITVFQSMLYFLVMFAALFAMERKYAPASGDVTRRNLVRLIFVIIAFNPATLAILMVFWKDILFGSCILISVALIGRLFEVKSPVVHTTLLSLALACAVLFRANGFLYLIVVVPLAVIFLDVSGRRSVLISSGVAILAYAGYKYAMQRFGIQGGQGTWIMHALALPLQTLAYAGLHNLIADPTQLSFVQRLFDINELPKTFNSYTFATVVFTSLRMDVVRDNYGQILATWLSFAMAHPAIALQIGLKMGWMNFLPFQIEPFKVWLSPSQSDSPYLWHGDAPFQHLSMTPTFWDIATALDKFISHPVQYALLSPATSIWMSIIFLVVFVWKSAPNGIRAMKPQDMAPVVALGSVICFALGNALIYVGPDTRYTWFLYGVAALAFGLAFIRQKERHS